MDLLRGVFIWGTDAWEKLGKLCLTLGFGGVVSPAVDFYLSLDKCQETSVEVEIISINETSRSSMLMSETSTGRVSVGPVNYSG